MAGPMSYGAHRVQSTVSRKTRSCHVFIISHRKTSREPRCSIRVHINARAGGVESSPFPEGGRVVMLQAEQEPRGRMGSDAERALEVASLGALTRDELNRLLWLKYEEARRRWRASGTP